MRTCPKCQTSKDLSQFPKRLGARDGIRNRCKACTEVYQRSHKLKNQEYYDRYWREYFKNRYNSDLEFKLRHWIRKTVNRGIFQKKKSTIAALGCTISELKNHLESQFANGMSWENHGDWHIDHKIPLSSFNLSDISEFSKACNYKNLQPLWAIDNIRKSDS